VEFQQPRDVKCEELPRTTNKTAVKHSVEFADFYVGLEIENLAVVM
jgi:hypothetical protein